MQNWFSYDPEDGITFHDTAEEAKAGAERILDDYRDHAGDGWPENITDICWGGIRAQTAESSRLEVPEGVTVDDQTGMGSDGVDYSKVFFSEWDYIVNYKLVDEPPPLMLVSGGGRITDDSRRAIDEFLKKKGLDNVMVMEMETTFNQADMDSAVDEERQRIAKLFCKDCASGRPRSISSLLGGTPHWFHATGAASGRNCEAAPVWGPPQR